MTQPERKLALDLESLQRVRVTCGQIGAKDRARAIKLTREERFTINHRPGVIDLREREREREVESPLSWRRVGAAIGR